MTAVIKSPQTMNEQNGLIGFLQKKSLFRKDDPKKRSAGSSNGDRSSLIRTLNKDIEPPLSLAHDDEFSTSKTNYLGNQQTHFQNGNRLSRFTSFGNQSPLSHNNMLSSRFAESKVRKFQNEPEVHYNKFVKQQKNSNRHWDGSGAFSMSFESARVESAQCLQTLSLKLKAQIANAQYRIEQFRNNIFFVLTQELKQLKHKILIMVEEVFKDSEKSIKQYMRAQEERVAGDLLQLKTLLQKEYLRIEDMKDQMNGPQWRKVAGEILSTGLESSILGLIEETSKAEVGRWQKRQWGNQHLINLSRQLRDVVQFRQ